MIRTIGYIAVSDRTHSLGIGADRASTLMESSMVYIGASVVCAVMIFVLQRGMRKRAEKSVRFLIPCASLICTGISCGVQMLIWGVFNSGYEYLHIHVWIAMLTGMLCFVFGKRTEISRIIGFGVWGGYLSLAAIMALSNMDLLHSMGHLGVAAVFAFACAGKMEEEACFDCEEKRYCHRIVWRVLLLFCVTAIGAKGYTLRTGKNFNNVFQSEAHIMYGPAKGCITDFQTAQMYNRTYEAWENIDCYGSKMLVVTNTIQSTMNTQYMFSNSEICHYSIIDPTDYDEKLEQYWRLYPNKYPDVIAVDCVMGELAVEADSWIMEFIENDFGYADVVETPFVRLYIADAKTWHDSN